MKRVVITGANSGIGLAASHRFASEGYHVIMACRNLERGQKALEQVETDNGRGTAELMELDCSSLASIQAFATSCSQRFDRLDILIHNAAYFNHGSPWTLSCDGIELTFATNVLAPWLLTRLLLKPLSKSDDARILNAGSNIIKHFFNPKLKLDLEHMTGTLPEGIPFSVYNRYRDSKMALLMLTFRLAEELESYGISVAMLQINGAKMSPETLQKMSPRYRLIAHIQNLFFQPPDFMAHCYFELTTSKRFHGVSGILFNHHLVEMKPSKENPGIRDQIRQVAGADLYPRYANDRLEIDRVWNTCQELAGHVSESIVQRDEAAH